MRGFLEIPKGARLFEYGLRSGGKVLASGGARLIDEDEDWPAGARADWEGLVSADGQRLMLAVKERVAEVDERWKPIKWIWEKGQRGARSVVLAGPRLAAEGEKCYLDLLAGSAPKLKIVELPPEPEKKPGEKKRPPARGIYRLVELVESQVAPAAGSADLVVVVAPPADPETATTPRRYRQGLDWILARLKRAGARRVALVPPLTRKVPARQLAAYARMCKEAAAVYRARFVEPEKVLADKYWVPEGADGKVTGRWPNAAGQELLAGLVRGSYR